MSDAERTKFSVTRILIASHTFERLTGNERLLTLMKACGSRPLTLTVWLDADHDLHAVRPRVLQLFEELASPVAMRQINVQLVGGTESIAPPLTKDSYSFGNVF